MTDIQALQDLAQRLMPAGFGVSVLLLSQPAATLLPKEEAAVLRAVPKRRHEFALGRTALRQAIRMAGHDFPDLSPIAALPDRRPDLPSSIRASLSHSGQVCIAIAAPPGGPWVGVDVEPTSRDTPAGLAEVVAPYRPPATPPLLAFCVKEAMFKAQYPLTRRMLDFAQVPAVLSGHRVRGCMGTRLIGARWGEAAGYYLAISLWRG